jgi:hypothetical protein
MAIRSHSTLAEVKEQLTEMPALTAAETITPTHQAHKVTLPEGADVNVDIITAGQPGQLLVLVADGTGTDKVVFRDTEVSGVATGANINIAAGTSTVIFDGADDSAIFVYDGSKWVRINSLSVGADQS